MSEKFFFTVASLARTFSFLSCLHHKREQQGMVMLSQGAARRDARKDRTELTFQPQPLHAAWPHGGRPCMQAKPCPAAHFVNLAAGSFDSLGFDGASP